MVWPLPTCITRRSTVISPPVTWARVTTRMVAATERQSARFGDSGSIAGRASMSDGSTKRKRRSKRRSRRRTSVMTRHASRLAWSPARGTQAGTASRSVLMSLMMMVGSPGAWPRTTADVAAITATAAAAAIALRAGTEDGADRESVRSIAPGKRREGGGGINGALGRAVEEGEPAALHDAHVGDGAGLRDGEADRDRLVEAGLDLPRPDHPDLPLHAREVPVAPGVAAAGNAGPRGGLDVEAG